MRWHTAHLALGSNLGDRLTAIRVAVRQLTRIGEMFVSATAPIVETAPLVDCPPGSELFLNTAVAVRTTLSAADLHERIRAIEDAAGRDRDTRNGPRLIDVDLLLYEDQIIQTPSLIVPHPRMHQRRFVLEPLATIAGDRVHPLLHRTVMELLEALDRPAPSGGVP